jgi:PAS domain S-box-containing protein
MMGKMSYEELEQKVAQMQVVEDKLRKSEEKYRNLVETLNEAIYQMSIPDGTYEYVSPSVQKVFGYTAEQLFQNPLLIQEIIHPDFHAYFQEKWEDLLKGIVPPTYEYKIIDPDGNERWIVQSNAVILGDNGEITRIEGILRDITENKLNEERLRRQHQEIMELSTPVISIWKGIIVVPLIGTLDSHRTQLFMERFLDAIVKTHSSVALVDITGAPTIDTQTAQHIIEAVKAARLLGTEVILTGIRAEIAQTLVHLGIDLSNIKTRSSLGEGLRLGLEALGLEVGVKKVGH